MDYLIFTLSMAALIYGAHLIIIEGERIALHYNISQFVIGATLIALGTSLPEMAASMAASFHHKSDLAIANILGSVILNISLVLGVVFLLAKKISPDRDLFTRDSAWSIFPIFIFILTIYDGKIDLFEGVLLLFIMGAYLLFLSKDAKEITAEIDEDLLKEKFNWPKSLILLAIGFAFTVEGADFAVE
ncbi:MAG: sodium:calcium antiporter, partial [Epsilonproteobacteria bacterium]|nr:sodium:calcium antiporter [Campylobacterota bacterium]